TLVYFLEASAATFANRPTGGVIIGGTERDVSGGVQLPPNVWTRLATTYDGATLRLYVNGLEVANTPATGQVTTPGRPLPIGGSGNPVLARASRGGSTRSGSTIAR